MTRHIFLTQRSQPLPRWHEAFPDARVESYAALRRPGFCKARSAIIWLHVEPGADAPSLVGEVMRAAPGCAVVVLANIVDEAGAYAAIQVGASGYAGALVNAEVLRQVALVVENEGIWVGRDLKARLLGAFSRLMPEPAVPEADELNRLSPRQRAVAEAVASGASNKEVARALAITERTVKAHLSSIFEHLGVRDSVQLALLVNRRHPPRDELKYRTGT
jgi:DNA-binding NarL/FixJ family response regulator